MGSGVKYQIFQLNITIVLRQLFQKKKKQTKISPTKLLENVFLIKKNYPPVDMKHKKNKRKKERLIEAESIYKNIALEKKKNTQTQFKMTVGYRLCLLWSTDDRVT